MKSLNKSFILNVIRTEGPISRAAIAKKTQLTPPTVTNIVAELMEEGLVIERTLGESKGGRKPILLTLNASAFQVIGVDVGTKQMRVIATDLHGKLIDKISKDVPASVSEDTFVSLLKESVHALIKKLRLNKDSILGIGVGMHGLVNYNSGIAIYAPNLNLHDMPLRDELERTFDIPVEVDNDVRAMALGESWFGHGEGIDNFICLNVGNGVGAGIIMDRKLYRGTSFTAGEVGHTTVDATGTRCFCGNDGCLQTFVSGPAIARRAQQQIRLGRESILARKDVTGKTVYEAAIAGDALAQEILRETGRYLGIGIANIINTFNPARVIIGGGVATAAKFIMEPLQKTVAARALKEPVKASTIVTAKLAENATAIGAVTLVLYNLFIPEYR